MAGSKRTINGVIARALARTRADAAATRVWAVVDAARDPRIGAAVRHANSRGVCLYGDDVPNELASAAPWVVPMPPDSTFGALFASTGRGHAWGIVTRSDAPREAVAHNVLGKHLRGRYREPTALDLAHVSFAELGDSPSLLIAADQKQLAMLTALRRIPVDHQVALELHYWEGMTAAELAEVLALPVGTAKTRLRRAKQLLAAELADLEAGLTGAEPTATRLDTWAAGIRRQVDRAP